jgi:hypothetical protein
MQGRTVRRIVVLLCLGGLPALPRPTGSPLGPSRLAAQAPQPRTRNVILVTLDGVRWQDLFGGMDSTVAAADSNSGIWDTLRVRRRYWRSTADERRRALMPFLWDSLVPQGVLLGNRTLNSPVNTRNPHWFSAPGYFEILTGRFQPDVTSNDDRRYDHRTVLEYVKEKLGLDDRQVAAVTSWEALGSYVSRRAGLFYVNAGYEAVPDEVALGPAFHEASRNAMRTISLDESSRNDGATGAIALAYLLTWRPRLLYVSFGETDDWAHQRRYDLVLDDLHALDDWFHELWTTVQSVPAYRGRTTLIITTDHGRGRTPRDWTDHGDKVPGAGEIWLAVIGPDTPPAGEGRDTPQAYQADIAATLLQFFGLTAGEFNPDAGPAVPGTFGPATARQ